VKVKAKRGFCLPLVMLPTFHGSWYSVLARTQDRVNRGTVHLFPFYHFDVGGRLTKLTDWIDDTDGIRYAYDNANRLTQLTEYDDSTLDYTYDDAGNVLTMNDYHGNSITYTYTDRNQVSTITAPLSRVWTYNYNDLRLIGDSHLFSCLF
jgi:YD repeat-containing protein